MRSHAFIRVLLPALVLLGSLIPAKQAQAADPLTVLIELVDGSMVRGQIEDRAVGLKTVYGKMRLRLADVAKIVFEPAGPGKRLAHLVMNNGDELTGRLDITTLSVHTILGQLTVPLSKVRTMATAPYVSPGPPVAYFPFDGNAVDEMNPSRSGIVQGARLTEDRFGNPNAAYVLDPGNVIDLGDVLNDVDVPLTISAWLYVTGNRPPYSIFNSDRKPFQRPTEYFGFYFIISSKNTLGVSYGDSGRESPQSRRSLHSAIDVPLGRWIHAVGVMEGPRAMRLYIDGRDVSGAYGGSGGPMVHTDLPAIIGGDYQGKIDDLTIFNRALSEEEIQHLYHQKGWKLGQ